MLVSRAHRTGKSAVLLKALPLWKENSPVIAMTASNGWMRRGSGTISIPFLLKIPCSDFAINSLTSRETGSDIGFCAGVVMKQPGSSPNSLYLSLLAGGSS